MVVHILKDVSIMNVLMIIDAESIQTVEEIKNVKMETVLFYLKHADMMETA